MNEFHILSLHIIVFLKHPIPCRKLCICRRGGEKKLLSRTVCSKIATGW